MRRELVRIAAYLEVGAAEFGSAMSASGHMGGREVRGDTVAAGPVRQRQGEWIPCVNGPR
jgi:hypothetical protein